MAESPWNFYTLLNSQYVFWKKKKEKELFIVCRIQQQKITKK